MDKLNMQTANIADENFKKLAELFPNAVTETINESGEIVRAIDKDVLMQEINTSVVEGREERYQFTWPDKRKAIIAANAPTTNTLRPCREDSVNFDSTENLYIEGDNLEVLKLLQENYLGQVKMIYIDPPYNTGNDFVYEDDFAESTAEYLANSGQYDEDGNRLTANTESNGRFHTDWLNMIYPRLKVARNLLSDDGVIFISIDDNEEENLKKVCNEIFGESNFVGELIWQTATDNNPRQITIEHEYVLCYSKNKNVLPAWIVTSSKAQLIVDFYKKELQGMSDLEEAQRKLRTWMKKNEALLQGVMHYNCLDEKGVYTANTNSSNTKPGGYTYDILHPATNRPCAKPAYGWRWAETTFWKYADNGDVEWGKDETTQPHIKKRVETATELLKSIYYEDGRASTILIENLFGKKKIFDNPKAIGLIKRIINYGCQDKNATILDFFSGSATTAHAIMQLNAEEGGSRKFIMVQLPEKTDEKSEAYKAGYKNICEIGKERIRRAAKKIKDENPDAQFDGGFRVLKLDTSNMQQVYYTPETVVAQSLWETTVDNIKEGRTSEDLLFQAMLELNVPLSSPIKKETIDGKEVFNVADGYILACFDNNLTDEIITDIAKRKPYFFVMRDSSMADDSVAVNFEQLFKSYSPETILKVF